MTITDRGLRAQVGTASADRQRLSVDRVFLSAGRIPHSADRRLLSVVRQHSSTDRLLHRGVRLPHRMIIRCVVQEEIPEIIQERIREIAEDAEEGPVLQYF